MPPISNSLPCSKVNPFSRCHYTLPGKPWVGLENYTKLFSSDSVTSGVFWTSMKATGIFTLFSVIPGSFVSAMGDDGRGPMDPQVMERMRIELGLDDPVPVRFVKYVRHLAVGDFGTSFRTREPVTTMSSL